MSVITSDPAAPARARERRIIEAALACIERWGVAKTSLDDVAREAGLSRATVYRVFPGGKESLLEAVAAFEVECFFAFLAERLEAAADLEEMLVAGMSEAADRLRCHGALQYLVQHEPEVILPRVTLSGMDGVLRVACDFAEPYLARWVGADRARPAAEWVTRLVLSYASCPSEGADLADSDAARRVVRDFVLPALASTATQISRKE